MDASSYWAATRLRRLSRRRFVAAGVSVSALGAAGCAAKRGAGGKSTAGSPAAGEPDETGEPRSGGNLNVLLTNITTIRHRYLAQSFKGVTNTGIGVMSQSVFRFQSGRDPATSLNHIIENDLGMSAESPNAATWTVKLRPDARFQNIAPVNGHPVEAEDVKTTFTRALDPAINNPNRGGLTMMDPAQIATPDARTIVFKLNYPYSPFRSLLADGYYGWIYPREALAGSYDPAKVAIGSGPYLLDSGTPDVAFSYKRNAAYFESGHPYLDTWKYAIVPDASQQLAQFTAGNLDELIITDPYQVPTVQQQNPKAALIKVAAASPYPLYFQLGDPASIFQDLRVRQAFSLAIDRDAISRTIYGGQAQEVVYVPASMGKWAMQVSDLPSDVQQFYKFDPDNARKLLAAAGQTNLELKLAYPNTFGTPIFTKQAETIANMLGAVGVKATIVIQDYFKDFIGPRGSRNGFFDKDTIMYVSAAPFSDPDGWLFSYFHSKSTANQEHLKDPAYDAMVDKQRTLVNEDERLKAVRDIQTYLARQMYAPSTAGTYNWIFVQPRVRGYQYSSNTINRATETYAKAWVSS